MTFPADRLRAQLRQRAELDFARRVDRNHRLYAHLRSQWEQVADTGAADPRAFNQMFEWRFDTRPWGLLLETGEIVAADVGDDPDRSVSLEVPGVIDSASFTAAVRAGRVVLLTPFTREEQKTAVFVPFAEELAGVVDDQLAAELIALLRERSGEKKFRDRLDEQLRHEFDRFRVIVGTGFIAGQAARENVAAVLASATSEPGTDQLMNVLLELRGGELLAALVPLATWAVEASDPAGMQVLRHSLLSLAKSAPSDVLGAVPVPARFIRG